MGLNDEMSVKFVQAKLTYYYNEIIDELKTLIQDKYDRVMKAKTTEELRHWF